MNIESRIYNIRGMNVMLDEDLAEIYGVTTSRLNEQVRRNRERFPDDFAFKLHNKEYQVVTNLRSQIAISSSTYGGRRFLPFVFTEHGAVMLATVLNTPTAVQSSIAVVRAFVHYRQISKPAASVLN